MEEMQYFGKPDPRAYQIVENRYPGFDEIILIDDSIKNLDAAYGRGWKTVFLRRVSQTTIEVPECHIVINSLEEVAKLMV